MKLFPWLLSAVLGVALWFTTCREPELPADINSMMDRLEAHEALLPTAIAQRDSARAENVLKDAALDSAHAETARVQTAAQATVTAARARASQVATDLNARLDSTEAAMFAEYQAEVDSIDAAQDLVVSVLTTELSTAYFRIAGLETELEGERGISRQLQAANDALHIALDAANAQLRAQERTTRLLQIGGGIAVGKLGYDALTGES